MIAEMYGGAENSLGAASPKPPYFYAYGAYHRKKVNILKVRFFAGRIRITEEPQ